VGFTPRPSRLLPVTGAVGVYGALLPWVTLSLPPFGHVTLSGIQVGGGITLVLSTVVGLVGWRLADGRIAVVICLVASALSAAFGTYVAARMAGLAGADDIAVEAVERLGVGLVVTVAAGFGGVWAAIATLRSPREHRTAPV